jgi:hypothetical protein
MNLTTWRTAVGLSTSLTTEPDAEPILLPQFDDLQQQADASNIGMWIFLATEVLFFGGLITAYVVYRATSPREFALSSQHLKLWLGCVNTVVLLSSSLTMALAVRSAQLHLRRNLLWFLGPTMALGLASWESRQSNTAWNTATTFFRVPVSASPTSLKSRSGQARPMHAAFRCSSCCTFS